MAGLDAAPHAAKQIQFPRGIEARLVLSLIAAKRGGTLLLGESLLRVRAARGDGRRQVEARLAMECARFLDMSERDAEVVIGEQRVADQLVEGRIAKLRPELGDGVLLGVC